MTAKYYTQFTLTDCNYERGNEFQGVVELSKPLSCEKDRKDIEEIIAANFDLEPCLVRLVSWYRLH